VNTPLVSICCLAYNHEPYIRECLDGFMMQQCDFKFEVLIHDDASTDGTADIIREYEAKFPEILKPIYQTENQYSKGLRNISARLNYPRARGKYIALCEGDDYWTDPLKLQKQVDFLEGNPEYILACHNYKILNYDGETYRDEYEYNFVKDKDLIEIDESIYLSHWLTKTLTVMFLNDSKILAEFNSIENKRDLSLFYVFIKNGKGIFQNFYGAIYRKQKKGVYSSQTRYETKIQDILILEELYQLHNSDIVFQRIQREKMSAIYFQFKYAKTFQKIPFIPILSLKLPFSKRVHLLASVLYNNAKKFKLK